MKLKRKAIYSYRLKLTTAEAILLRTIVVKALSGATYNSVDEGAFLNRLECALVIPETRQKIQSDT